MNLRILHGASVLASALLLFLIEPMVAKALLPLYGGSPAVWNTCLLFFQGLLLLGYAYAHFGSRVLGHRGHLIAHAALLVLPLVLLPPRIPIEGPPPTAWPVPSLLWALMIAVGLPFLVLASNSSLMQRWHALRSGESPYFLYAASNIGSFFALIAYPFLVEPALGIHAQLKSWSIGYIGYLLLGGGALVGAWRAAPTSERPVASSVSGAQKLRWLIRSAIPSSLLLAVSFAITTDVAAIPLLWVLPLALYLGTFVIAFWPRMPFPRRALVVLGSLLICVILGRPWLGRGSLLLGLGMPLSILTIGSWICHADLARDRPDAEHVTQYYLWISLGGFLGGVFGNLVAPRLFSSIAEYPLSLALLAVMFSVGADQGAGLMAALKKRSTFIRLILGAAPFLAWGLYAPGAVDLADAWDYTPLVLMFVALALSRFPGQFAVASLSAALVCVFVVVPGVRTLDARRSFFGVVRVREWDGARRLVHGTTKHGEEQWEPFDPTPKLYYEPFSPLARAVSIQNEQAMIGAVGLGAGSIAYYGKAGQHLRFYEIDPIIEPLARRWFTFLDKSAAQIEVKLGDARLTLQNAEDRSFDMLLIDAFSSDAIPVHLMTDEAVRLYMQKLKSDGFVVFHVSNRHLNLVPVLRAIAKKQGLSAANIVYDPDEGTFVAAVALAAAEAPLQRLLDRGWKKLEPGREQLWTDDFSSLLSVITR
jgi:hypothetical protein